jgi:uncharacterized membrane protein YhfC
MTPWFRPSVAVAMIGGGALVLALPVVIGVIIRRRTGASWRAFGLGAATFFASQCVLRLPWQIPLGLWLGPRIKDSAALFTAWLAASALTAALFEECGRYVALRWFSKDERSWRVGLMLGAGHGGLEAMIVGLTIAGNGVFYAVVGTGASASLPPEALVKVQAAYAALGPIDALAGTVERFIAVAAQMAMSVVVAQVFVRAAPLSDTGGVARLAMRWLAIAIGMHFVLDFAFAGAAMTLVKRTGSAMVGELALLPALFVAVWVIWRTREGLKDGLSRP